MSGRKYDMIVFGASGFTGKYVVEEIGKLMKNQESADKFTWAVAGRSIKKLEAVLDEASTYSGVDLRSIDKIVADVEDESSLKNMASLCTVVLNCVGPYRLYGEMVVKACVDQSTSHIDISGETQWLELMELKYKDLAKEKNIYIVGACGFDSIPTDIGTIFLKQNFKGDMNSIETYLEMDPEKSKKSVIHYGTWHSAIHFLAFAAGELRKIRAQLFKEPLPKSNFELKNRSLIHYNEFCNGWCLPFPGTDKSIMERTQRYFYENNGDIPAQINTYVKQSGLIMSFLTLVGVIFIGVFAQFSFGRYLLETFPRLFSLGFVSHEGPTREEADVPFIFTLVAQGWSEKLLEKSDKHMEPPNKKMIVKVSGRNPGYGATCICMIQSGISIIKERSLLPSSGGVYTPGSAFANTSIIKRLSKNGLTFTIQN